MRRTLAVIFLTVFIDLVGVGMVVPVLPQLFGNPDSPVYMLGGGDYLKLGLILNGILFSIYSLAQFVASPLLGQLSDRIGRRKVLAGAMLITAIAQASFAYSIGAVSIILLFLARTLAGVASGNLPVAQAIIADTTPKDKRSSALGIIGAAFGLGLIFGPYLGGKLMTISPSAPFYAAAVLAFINCIFILITLKETHKVKYSKKDESIPRLSIREAFIQIKRAFTHKKLKPIFIAYFFMQFGFAVYLSFASVHLLNRFHLSEEHLGGYFTFAGICAVIAQVVIVRYVAKHHNEKAVIAPSLVLNALGLMGIALAHNYFSLYLSTFIYAAGYGLVYANISALITNTSDDDERGEALGYLGSVMALGLAIPPLFGGVIAVSLSPQSFLLLSAFVVLLTSIYFRKRRDRYFK